jgi:hypothetical protein
MTVHAEYSTTYDQDERGRPFSQYAWHQVNCREVGVVMSEKTPNRPAALLAIFATSLVLTVSFLLMPIPANAETTEAGTQTIEVEILSPEQAQELLSEDYPETKGFSAVTLFIVRNSGTNCELYVKWNGTYRYNSFRYKRMIVRENSINAKVFLNQYKQYQWFYVHAAASPIGTAHVAYLNIPVGISNVYIDAREFQGYNLDFASWIAHGIKGPETVG